MVSPDGLPGGLPFTVRGSIVWRVIMPAAFGTLGSRLAGDVRECECSQLSKGRFHVNLGGSGKSRRRGKNWLTQQCDPCMKIWLDARLNAFFWHFVQPGEHHGAHPGDWHWRHQRHSYPEPVRRGGASQHSRPEHRQAVLVSALTTMAGFGSLMVAKHQGIASLGKVMLIGTGMCMLASLVLLPAVLNLLSGLGWTMTRKRRR